MSVGTQQVTVSILDREYKLSCSDDERQALIESARLIDGKMREIRNGARMLSAERVAVLAALNLAHELQKAQRHRSAEDQVTEERLTRIRERLDRALTGSVR